ncbi:tyrosine-type recombinase/integrase [Herbiconiux sp. VKM Ac-2851]|uniref:tyrosine-type recombinase/integrase n=1 Tax=Herbiconiux sp. VKM Ac-2851 TaxID=2739025 RepID=UPI001563527A|nr:tyrosine-type recombinase/integrase [Herbiconiux sp. VKM Ac-2851]NQX35477.1 tyrosine-type recombinase/integrase [Herbiconiux sp. VKM Ac-2851]
MSAVEPLWRESRRQGFEHRLLGEVEGWADYLSDFADYERSKGLADTTVNNRKSILRSLGRGCDRGPLDVTVTDLRRQIGRPNVAAGTRRTERGAFLAFFTFLQDDGHRVDNPALKLPPVRAPKGTPRPFSSEQITAMLDSGAYRKTRAMILLGYYQGFRVSSIARVHGADIDVRENTIRTVGKGSKVSTFPLHPVIGELAMSMPRNDWWFPSQQEDGGPIKSVSVTNVIARAVNRAGITDPKLTPHSLRHAYATDMVEGGVDIRVIQELLGHSSLDTTMIYAGVSTRRKRDGILALPSREIPKTSNRAAAVNA